MKRKTVIIIVVIVAIIIIAISAWIFYKNLKKDEFKDTYSPEGEEGTGGDTTPVSSGGGYSSASFPVQKGMSGSLVAKIQDSINNKCKSGLVTDGKFGPMTESALKSCYGTTVVTQALFNQMTSAGTTPAPTGFATANQRLFLKGNVANIYSYPSFASNYIVGSVEKSFFLDKPIGLYISPATGGFSKIKVFGYKPYGSTQYKIEAKEVYVATSSLSKTAY